MVLGERDASGRRRPIGTGEMIDIPADTVIAAVGEKSRYRVLPSIRHSHGQLWESRFKSRNIGNKYTRCLCHW